MKKIILTVIFLTPFLLFSQNELTLDLASSLELAMEKNPEIKIAEKEYKKAKAAVGEAYSNLLPQVNASANVQRSWDIQTNRIPNFMKAMLPAELGLLIPELDPSLMPDYVEFAFGLEYSVMYGATLTQPLFLGGAGVSGVQIASSAKRAAEQNYKLQKQNLIYNCTNAFYACLLANEMVSVQQEALNQAEENLAVVEKKYDVGSASGFDKMRAQVEVANLKPLVITAENNYKSALTGLRTVLGLEADTQVAVKGEFIYNSDELLDADLESLKTKALAQRPEILAFSQQKNMAKKGVAIARSSFMPKMFFQTDYSYLAMTNDINGLTQDEFSKGFTSAVSVQIPLFSGFKNATTYQKARLDYKIAQDGEKQLNAGILADVEISFNKFHESHEKFEAANQSVELAQEALRLANMMYDEGANTQLDVLSSQLALTQAKLNYISSLYEYQMSRYQIRKATGQLEGILN